MTALRELTPEQALRRLELIITRRLDGLLQGDHLGLLPGPGSESAEAREYQPGDDVRRMDWNVTARTTTPHVRDVVADRELETRVVVDTSASMDFGTGELEKRDLAVAAVGAIGFLTAGAGNRLGAFVLHRDGIRRVPARTGRSHLLGILRSLLIADRTAPGPAGPTLAEAIHDLRHGASRRGLVVVVSDFLDESGWETPLRRLASRHQLLAVEVIDPRELELPNVGLITLVDPETGRRREVSTANPRLRQRYAQAAAAQHSATALALRRAGAAHLRLRTDRDWLRDLVRHIAAQRRLARAAAHRPGGAA
jgi:uncharacterized protein (DUF58 family)